MPGPNAASDRNLLFGVLALQMDFIRRDALIAAMQAWVFDKAKPLGQVLVEQGGLSATARDGLEAVVQMHVEMHDGDPEKSLASVSSVGSVRDELQRLDDPALHASLARLSRSSSEEDPYVTRLTAGQVSAPAASRYRVLRPHAKGGLGEVFVAHDEELHREVALKEIQPRHADHPESRARFVLEAEVTGGLEHPSIVPVYGLGHYADGRPYYAMRFIRGDSLKDAIERFHVADVPGRDPGERSLAFRQLLRRFVDVCNAVAYAHSRGVLHRDLKPGNVMLGKYGETLVVDWGLAKPTGKADATTEITQRPLQPVSASDSAPTAMGEVLGTPAYMSPEQAEGRLDLLGPASDVYSLGALLYCLLTGRAPFTGPDIGDVLQKVQRGEFAPPSALQPGRVRSRFSWSLAARYWKVSPPLEAVCLKAMALRPEDRYATATALTADVEHWLADEPVSAYREPLSERLRRWARRHRTLATSAAVSIAVALLGVTVVTIVLIVANGRLQVAYTNENQARTKAQENYQLAREAVDKYLKAVSDNKKLKNAGLYALRQELIRDASAFYTRFLEERADDPDLRAELANAVFQKAFIEKEIGQQAEAIRLYQGALELTRRLADEHPEVPEYQAKIAQCHINLGVLYRAAKQVSEAEDAYKLAREVLQRLGRRYPEVRQHQADLAASHNNLGVLCHTNGRIAEAESAHKAALDIRKRLAGGYPDDLEYQVDLAKSYSNLGALYTVSGKLAEAEDFHKAAHGVFQRLAERYDDVADYQANLAKSYKNLGLLYIFTDQKAEAEAAYKAAFVIWKRLVERHPEISEYRAELDKSPGKATEAEKAYEAIVDFLRRLVEQHPTVPQYEADLAASHEKLGDLYTIPFKTAEKEQAYKAALTIWNRLSELYDDVPDYQTNLAKSHSRLGLLYGATGKVAEAERACEAAREAFQLLAQHHPDIRAYSIELGTAHLIMGNREKFNSQPQKALVWYTRTIESFGPILKVKPRDVGLRQLLQQTHMERARVLSDLGRHQEALKDWDRMIELDKGLGRSIIPMLRAVSLAHTGAHQQATEDTETFMSKPVPVGMAYNAACVFAVSARAALHDTKLAPPEREQTAERYAARAMTLLGTDRSAGFFKNPATVAHLKKDPDLDPLRQREDFQKLLADLERDAAPKPPEPVGPPTPPDRR